MGKGPRWSEVEEEFLVECVRAGKDPFKISEEFHIRTKMNIKGYHKRSPAAIERRIKDLPEDEQPVDESKPARHRKRWNGEDDELLLHFESMGMSKEDMALEMNRTESAIESRLQVLKSQKSAWERIGENVEGVVSRLRTLFGSSGPGGK